jgi:hypothetical protein
MANPSQGMAIIESIYTLRSILDDLEIMLHSDSHNMIHCTGNPGIMHWENGFRSGSNSCLN